MSFLCRVLDELRAIREATFLDHMDHPLTIPSSSGGSREPSPLTSVHVIAGAGDHLTGTSSLLTQPAGGSAAVIPNKSSGSVINAVTSRKDRAGAGWSSRFLPNPFMTSQQAQHQHRLEDDSAHNKV